VRERDGRERSAQGRAGGREAGRERAREREREIREREERERELNLCKHERMGIFAKQSCPPLGPFNTFNYPIITLTPFISIRLSRADRGSGGDNISLKLIAPHYEY
jgi:hypothetical protein